MKFTKDDAYKELVAKLTTKGEKLNLSQRSINEQIEALLPLIANDEMEVVDFVEKVLPIVKTADANVRNDVSQGIKEYMDKNPKKEETEKTIVDKDNSELLKRIEALEEQRRAQELEIKVKGIKNELTTKLKELGVKSDKWLESLISNITIDENFDIEEKSKGYLELYNTMQSDIDINITPNEAGSGKQNYISNSIKEAAALAKSQSMIG